MTDQTPTPDHETDASADTEALVRDFTRTFTALLLYFGLDFRSASAVIEVDDGTMIFEGRETDRETGDLTWDAEFRVARPSDTDAAED